MGEVEVQALRGVDFGLARREIVGLPGLSALEVARRMRQLPARRDIPIVAVSGYARASDRRDAFQAGFSEHLAKSVDPLRVERFLEGPLPEVAEAVPRYR